MRPNVINVIPAPGIRDASGRQRAVYRCLDVEIDPVRACVFRAGQQVELRAKALLMLLFLVEQRHRVVSKEELFERLWPGTTVVDATLMGCIQEIRRALADDARTPRFIKTLPKLGYRFMAEVREVADDLPVETDHALPVIAPPAMPVDPTVPRKQLWRKVAVTVGIAGLLTGCVWLIAASRTGVARSDDSSAEVAWWKFDEGSGKALADSAGNAGLTGIATGGAWERGVMGGALRLDGTDQRVEGLDTLGILPKGSEPRSLAVWVKVASANGDTTGIMHFGTPLVPGTLDSFRLLLLPDGRPGFASQYYAGLGDDRSLALGRSRIDDGNWHHLTGTFANGAGALFVDGIQQAAVAMPAATKPPERQIHWAVGNHILQRYTGFRGVLDDVRIWRRALRPAEIATLYRCGAGIADVTTQAGTVYLYSPMFRSPGQASTVTFRASASEGESTTIEHTGFDYGGVQLVRRSQDCAMTPSRGADAGQDLRISVELLVPATSKGDLQAGPYFRSRRAAPGDGILGGSSAGYWLRLHSSGALTVKCLNPAHTVAFTKPLESFDAGVFHRLDAAVRGDTLEVALDGHRLTFDQGGQMTEIVKIPPDWERPAQVGFNRGSAGVAFSSEPMRPRVGGQQARRFSIEPYRPLEQ